MGKKTYKSATSRRSNHKRYRKTRRRKGGSRKCARRRRSNRVKRGGTAPPTSPSYDSSYLLYADDESGGWRGGRTIDTWFGVGYTGNVFGPPIDPNDLKSKTMVMGQAVDQGTRVTFSNVLHDGRTLYDNSGYKFIEIKGEPYKLYVSPNNIIKSSVPGNQDHYPMKKWPPPKELVLRGSGKGFGGDWLAPWKRGAAEGRKLY